VNLSAKYATAIVVAHLLVNLVHGLAHRKLHIGLAPPDSIFVIVVVLIFPLIAMGLLWTAENGSASFSCLSRCSDHCYSACITIFWLLAQITSIRSLRIRGGSRLF